MKKIFFAAQNFNVGGIQTSLINLINTIDDSYEVEVFSFSGGALIDKVPDKVTICRGDKYLNLISTPLNTVLRSGNIPDILIRIALTVYAKAFGSERLYEKLLRKHRRNEYYDVAISFFNDVPAGCFNKGTNLYVDKFTNAEKKVAWIHTDPVKSGFDKDYCRRIYCNFDVIVCVSKAVKEKFDMFLPEYSNKTCVVYNVFPEKEILEAANEYMPFEKKCFEIVTVGRVDNSTKRMDGIIRIVKRLKDEGVGNFKWRIVGDGPDMKRNTELVRELGVCDLVEFTGERKNPYPYIKSADLFALYSAYEGYPMVIGEAIVLGTKILTVNYAAAREQINEEQGIICENDEVFCETLKSLITGA